MIIVFMLGFSEPSSDRPELFVVSLPEGMPVHGDRQCYKATDETVQSNNTDDDDDDDDDDEDEKEVWIEDVANNCR